MTLVKLKRVYEDWDKSDGYRVLVDKLWPRGVKKEELQFDLWAKDVTPSSDIRKWFHQDVDNRWDGFVSMYRRELNESQAVKNFIDSIKAYPVVTLLYAAKNAEHNHAIILKNFIDENLKG